LRWWRQWVRERAVRRERKELGREVWAERSRHRAVKQWKRWKRLLVRVREAKVYWEERREKSLRQRTWRQWKWAVRDRRRWREREEEIAEQVLRMNVRKSVFARWRKELRVCVALRKTTAR